MTLRAGGKVRIALLLTLRASDNTLAYFIGMKNVILSPQTKGLGWGRVARMQYEAMLPMEPAHRPRPFGCGLRACPELAEGVTVKSGRTRTVVGPGPEIFILCYTGRNHHERF